MFRFRDGRQGELVPSALAPLVAFVLVILLSLSAGALAAQESGAALSLIHISEPTRPY